MNVVNQIMRPIDVATNESLAFIESYVGLKDLTVLEVGAGRGDLAAAMVERGAHVRAIDLFEDAVNEARSKGVDARLADFLDYQDHQFDALLFTRSLHHIHPLERAIQNALSLLKDSGILLVEEFGAELADAKTIKWLNDKLSAIAAAGSASNCEVDHPKHSSKTSSLEKWREHHFGHHWISDSSTVKEELAKVFTFKSPKMVPYMYRYAIDKLPENTEGYVALRLLHEEEIELIGKGELRAVGLCISGRKK